MLLHLPNPTNALRALRARWPLPDAVAGASFCDACAAVCDGDCRRDALRAEHEQLLLRAGLGRR